jgi:60kDa lysophospholipase
VHLRNREGHTPLFLAAAAGMKDHVTLLRDAGAHLHPDEVKAAQEKAQNDIVDECWPLALQGDT